MAMSLYNDSLTLNRNGDQLVVAPEMLLATDVVAVMPERRANLLVRPADCFARRDLPVPETTCECALYWHRRQGEPRRPCHASRR